MTVVMHLSSSSTGTYGIGSTTTAQSKSGMNNSAAVESAVDAYATRVLERGSPPEACIDPSVGPYVTSLLRCADLREPEHLKDLAEYDSLLELLEDQCSLDHDDAKASLRKIAQAVCTGVVPHEPSSQSASLPKAAAPVALYGGMGSLGTFRDMGEALNDATNDTNAADTTEESKNMNTPVTKSLQTPMTEQRSFLSPYTPASVTGPSPLKPDNLIPFDLLGALDNPSPQMSRTARMIEEHKIQHDQAFPPLGAPSPAVANTKKPSRGSGSRKPSRVVKDNKLAATLFAPSRPSQYVKSLSSSPEGSSTLHDVTTARDNEDHAAESDNNSPGENQFYQHQIESAVEILLSMNSDVGEGAAREAAIMASADFNIAQYIITAAISAPPVCRHMLNDGCYRSDCQFSHDVKGHTCLFWMRGRCREGAACKFLHGFNKKIMDSIPNSSPDYSVQRHHQTPSSYSPAYSSPPPQSGTGLGFSQSYSSFTSSGSSQDSMFGRSYENSSTASWDVSGQGGSPSFPTPGSFANIASQGYDQSSKFISRPGRSSSISEGTRTVPTVRIPEELWNPHENRDASAFHIPDPLERYHKVSIRVAREDVIDLHYQSVKTFPIVLDEVLAEKLTRTDVWIVTGTGHHVGSRTHQKGGGALEKAVAAWLQAHNYQYCRGRDRSGLGGALLVKQQ